jgi:hypothetical protein
VRSASKIFSKRQAKYEKLKDDIGRTALLSINSKQIQNAMSYRSAKIGTAKGVKK